MKMNADTFRRVLGAVPTTVTVVTIVDTTGTDRGMTVGALTALSLVPPLVLVCIGDDATLATAMRTAGDFGVSVLADDQAHVSRRFADRDARDFGGSIQCRGPAGTALLDGAAAHLECRIVARHPGGDHTVVVGEVTYATASSRLPLVHHLGNYARLSP